MNVVERKSGRTDWVGTQPRAAPTQPHSLRSAPFQNVQNDGKIARKTKRTIFFSSKLWKFQFYLVNCKKNLWVPKWRFLRNPLFYKALFWLHQFYANLTFNEANKLSCSMACPAPVIVHFETTDLLSSSSIIFAQVCATRGKTCTNEWATTVIVLPTAHVYARSITALRPCPRHVSMWSAVRILSVPPEMKEAVPRPHTIAFAIAPSDVRGSRSRGVSDARDGRGSVAARQSHTRASRGGC